MAAHWRKTYPKLSEQAPDGAIIVPNTIAAGFFDWLTALGLQTGPEIKEAYELQSNRAYLVLTADLPREAFYVAMQRSALADAVMPPGAHAN